MSHSESKRGGGWFLAAVCVLLALAAVYCLNSRSKGKSNTGEELSPTAPSAVVSPTPGPPSPTPTPQSPPSSPQAPLRASVSGTVRFADSDEPVSGTLVQLACTTFSLTTHSDQCGSYTLTGLPPKTGLWITAEDRLADLYMYDTSDSLELKTGENRTGLDLTLYRGKKGIISGKVVGTRICFDPAADHETTRPLEERYQRKETTPLSGVEMRLQGRSDHFSIKVYQEEFATTDEAGDYQFKNLPPGFYEVRAMSVPEAVCQDSSGSDVELKLEPVTDANFRFRMDAVSISGRITDENGKPLSGIDIREDPEYDTPDNNRGAFQTETDADGRYRLNHLPPASFVDAARYLSTGKHTGRCYDLVVNHGREYQRVPVITENSLKEGMKFLEVVARDADTPGGVPQLASTLEEDLPKSEGNTIVGMDFVLPDKEAILRKRGSISGYVVDSGGKPVQEWISVLKQIKIGTPRAANSTGIVHQDPSKDPCYSAQIDSEGHFEFPSVQAGQYPIQIHPERSSLRLRTEPTSVTVGEGEHIENFRVTVDFSEVGSFLEFSVLNAQTRQPAEWFMCILEYENGDRALPVEGYEISTEKTGEVVHFENLTAGRAKLSLPHSFFIGRMESYLDTSVDVEIKPGKTVLDPILLTPMGKLRGHVQEAGSGKPIEKYKFSVVREQSNPYGSIVSLRRDESRPGTFLMGLLIPGMNTLRFSADGYGSQMVNVDIKAGETTEQTIQMKPAGRLVGQVTCDGKPADSYRVCARVPGKNNDPSTSSSGGIFIEGTKTSNGAYECANLGEDEHDIFVEYSYPDERGIQYQVFQYDSARVKPGEELRKDFRFDENAEITGLIECSIWAQKVFLEVRNNLPDPFSFKPGQNRRVATLETEHAQTPYRIRYLSPGTYTVWVSYEDRQEKRYEMSPKTVTLQPGQVGTVDIAN